MDRVLIVALGLFAVSVTAANANFVGGAGGIRDEGPVPITGARFPSKYWFHAARTHSGRSAKATSDPSGGTY
jgi:hypothetical protein